ncbi:MAG: SH3 domain-containing protein [Proteobacteria bacterium]|nr:SH3 domain-containing protein [Pseudomonadota bacterium]
MNHLRVLLGIFLLSLAIPLTAEEAIVVRLSTVYAKASSASDQVARIEAGSTVEVFERKGGWKQIFSEQKSIIGWVRSYQVRTVYSGFTPEIKTEPDSRGLLSGLASFSRMASSFFGSGGGTSGSARTATIGIRGLSEEEIRGARPDLEELDRMQQFASSSTRMPGFTQEGQLVARNIAHIEDKKK